MKTLLIWCCFLVVTGQECLLGPSPGCTVNLNEATYREYYSLFRMFERLSREDSNNNCLLGSSSNCTVNLEEANPWDFYNLYRMFEEIYNKNFCHIFRKRIEPLYHQCFEFG